MNPGVPGSLVGVVQTSCGADHECRHILDLVAPVNPVATVLLAEGLPESARGRQVGRWATAHQQQVLAMSQNDAPRHGWRWRSLRRLGFDRNPMRRGTDRIQAIIRVGLLVVFLAGAPAAAVYAGHVIYLSGMRAERAEAAAWHRVPAVILRVTPTATGWSRSAASALLSVQWVRTDGSWGTGKITGAKTALAGGGCHLRGDLTPAGQAPAGLLGDGLVGDGTAVDPFHAAGQWAMSLETMVPAARGERRPGRLLPWRGRAQTDGHADALGGGSRRRQRCSSLSRVSSRSRPRCSRWRVAWLTVPLS